MNAYDVMKYGHRTALQTVDGFPEGEWETDGVCGVWSVKQIIAHLASFEQVLIEVLNSFLGGGETPYLDEFTADHPAFNDNQVAKRDGLTWRQVMAEYKDVHAQVMELIGRIPEETIRRSGTLPWYGMEYALDDFIVYSFYGHKREHCAQINVFRDIVG